ncbi:MAG TPA: gamma-aminobutyraldehyde dehydrogenase, partial [Arthrobacter sp.]
MITLHNIINGEIVQDRAADGTAADGSAGPTLPFFDPATGVQLGTAPDSDAATVDRAFQAAHIAFQSYKRT